MPRTLINPVAASPQGAQLVFSKFDMLNGLAFANTGDQYLIIRNGSANPQTVTVHATAKVDTDLAVADRLVTVPAGELAFIGPFAPSVYNQLDGTAAVDCTAAIGVMVVQV